MKHILILLALLLTTGCGTMPVDGYAMRAQMASYYKIPNPESFSSIEEMKIAANEGKPPVNFLGLKLYPHAAAKILMTKHNFGSPTTVTVTSRTYTRGNTTTTYHTVYGLRR